MKRLIQGAAALVMLTGAITATAQDPGPEWYADKSTESNVDFHTTSWGVFGLDLAKSQAGFVAPRGSGKRYLFGSGIWFAAVKRVVNDKGVSTMHPLCFISCDMNTGKGWGTPGEGGDLIGLPTAPAGIQHSVDYDRYTGIRTATTQAGVSDLWGLWKGLGSTASVIDPGTYVPFESDRGNMGLYDAPAFLSSVSEQFVARFNDFDLTPYRTEMSPDTARARGYPLGLQFEQNIYSWKNGRYKNVVVLQYKVINVGGDTLFDCAVAQVSDPDLGNASNDHAEYFSTRPDLRAMRVWTEQEATGEYGQLVMLMIEAPVVDAAGFVDNSYRQEYKKNGRIGTSEAYTIGMDPRADLPRYEFLTSGNVAVDDGVHDYRTAMASTKFSLAPGDTAHFTIAFAVLYGSFDTTGTHGANPVSSATSSDDEALINFGESINADYYNSRFSYTPISSVGADATSSRNLTIVPNPAQDRTVVEFTLDTRTNVTLRLLNNLGEALITLPIGECQPGTHRQDLDISGIPAGAYILVVDAGGTRTTKQIDVVR